MQTIKTGVVVALLLAVCYGAFVALNAPDPQVPEELQLWAQENGDLDGLMDGIEMGTEMDLSSMETPGGFGSPDNMGLPVSTSTSSAPALPDFDQQVAMGGLPTAPPSLGTASTGSSLPVFPSIAGPALLDSPDAASTTAGLPTAAAHTTPATTASATRDLDATDLDSLPADSLANAVNLPAAGGFAPLPSEDMASQPVIPKFSLARESALKLAQEQGELRKALAELSPYYNSPELTYAEHSDLVDILDGLAREVIYSKRHMLLPSHVATASDTVAGIAEKYSITPELVSNLNDLGTAKVVTAGTKLKVLQGPFSAQVSLSRQELTLFLGELYAGRFPVSFGSDPSPAEGTFEVVDRQRDRTYYGNGGAILAANDPRNPYGGYWINLGRDLCIHGTPEMESADLAAAGCISLAPLDAKDVYNILTQSSQVTIVK